MPGKTREQLSFQKQMVTPRAVRGHFASRSACAARLRRAEPESELVVRDQRAGRGVNPNSHPMAASGARSVSSPTHRPNLSAFLTSGMASR